MLPFRLRNSKKAQVKYWVNPLSPSSDENEISLHIITIFLNVPAMVIRKVITKDEKCLKNRKENIYILVYRKGIKGLETALYTALSAQ